jgi:hypothetical protein
MGFNEIFPSMAGKSPKPEVSSWEHNPTKGGIV